METNHLGKNWWIILVRGLITIIFGFLAIFQTGATLDLLMLFLIIYLLIDGLFALISAIKAAVDHKKWYLFFFEGIADAAVAVLIALWPDLSIFVLLYIIGLWAIITGGFELWAAVTAGWSNLKKWSIGVAGTISVIIGILMVTLPLASLVAIIWVFGIYALIFGISLIVFSLTLRKA